ncbi:hypothetical protein [Catenulispora subtropica]|uniref:hypothetical protein n=1 Tax=Catenulispora subtropica TaxID=450798 RepID=UPI0031D5BBEF
MSAHQKALSDNPSGLPAQSSGAIAKLWLVRSVVASAARREVDQARAVGGQQHLGGLHVAVHQPLGVDRGERSGDPGRHLDRGLPG